MPTTTSIAHELWTADEFLDWLEPGVFADLIDGEILNAFSGQPAPRQSYEFFEIGFLRPTSSIKGWAELSTVR
jgi:hypothetical protein